MSFKVYFEDGKGNAMDEHGLEPVQMEVDEEAYSLDDVTNYDLHMYLKLPEKEKRAPNKLVDRLEGKVDDDVDNLTEKRGRKPLLNANHKGYLEKSFGENPSVTIDQAMDSLTNQFEDLKVSKQTVRDFMINECALSFKKVYFYPTERNSLEKIQQRYEWVINWSKTDLDYQSNCVFIDEAAFNVNLKRTMGWSKKGERVIVEIPTTRAQTTTILGAISPHGIINVKVRRPYQSASKKRKLHTASSKTSGFTVIKTTGTVTGHYFNFIASTLDVLDMHERFKGFYIVMNNVPIHKNTDIERYIINKIKCAITNLVTEPNKNLMCAK